MYHPSVRALVQEYMGRLHDKRSTNVKAAKERRVRRQKLLQVCSPPSFAAQSVAQCMLLCISRLLLSTCIKVTMHSMCQRAPQSHRHTQHHHSPHHICRKKLRNWRLHKKLSRCRQH